MNLRVSTKYKLIAAWVTLLMGCCLTSLAQQQDTSTHQILVDTQSVVLEDTASFSEENDQEAQTSKEPAHQLSDQTDTISYSYPDSLVNRSVSENKADSFRNARAYAYANDPRYWTTTPLVQNEQKESRGLLERLLTSQVFRIILYALLGLLLVYVIYRIIVNNSLFYRPSRKLKAEETIMEEEIKEVDLDAKIRQALASADQRAAIRFMYLKGLQRLDLAGLIRYHPQATNYEYTRQMKAHPLLADFAWLTHVYEYIWYGEFTVNEDQFGQLQSQFEKFYKSVRS